MKIGPKYKIARRLGAPIFEKTQTAKYALRSEKKIGFKKQQSNFGKQMNEKQKARFSYGISEKQFKNYVKKILDQKLASQNDALFERLERRIDNVVYRSGFASTRSFARQLVGHGHILLNGKKLTIPSYEVRKNDVISWREGSKKSPLYMQLDEKMKDLTSPEWIEVDPKIKTAKVTGEPKYKIAESHFDISAIFEYYRR